MTTVLPLKRRNIKRDNIQPFTTISHENHFLSRKTFLTDCTAACRNKPPITTRSGI